MVRTVRPLTIALSLVALAALGSGCAVTKTEYSRDGFYAGAAVTGNLSDFDDVEDADLGSSDYTAGIALRGGFRFLDRFALEVGYDYSDDFEFDNDIDVSLQAFTVNGKFYPLTGRFQPYGLVGAGLLDGEINEVDFDETSTFYRAGIGIEAYIVRWLPVFFEVDYKVPGGDLDELNYSTTQLGVLFRF